MSYPTYRREGRKKGVPLSPLPLLDRVTFWKREEKADILL